MIEDFRLQIEETEWHGLRASPVERDILRFACGTARLRITTVSDDTG